MFTLISMALVDPVYCIHQICVSYVETKHIDMHPQMVRYTFYFFPPMDVAFLRMGFNTFNEK
jgi:hypothetical protein